MVGDDSHPGQVDRAMLIRVVERLLDRSGAATLDWCAASVPYTTFLSGRALWSIAGTANVAGDVLPWKLILKVVRPPVGEGMDVTSDRSWLREVDAYRSGVLDDLPGNLRAPQVIRVEEDSSGAMWLWLEHVTDLYERRWPLVAYAVAARHLGQFNGAYLTSRPMPTFPWLMPDWAMAHGELTRVNAALLIAALDRGEVLPVVRRALDNPLIELTEFGAAPIHGGYAASVSGGGVYRVAGIARHSDKDIPWSLIPKIARAAPRVGDGTDVLRREMMLYRSGFLSDLPGRFVAPRCYGASLASNGVMSVWLEDLRVAKPDTDWTIEDYAFAAHQEEFIAASIPMRRHRLRLADQARTLIDEVMF